MSRNFLSTEITKLSVLTYYLEALADQLVCLLYVGKAAPPTELLSNRLTAPEILVTKVSYNLNCCFDDQGVNTEKERSEENRKGFCNRLVRFQSLIAIDIP